MRYLIALLWSLLTLPLWGYLIMCFVGFLHGHVAAGIDPISFGTGIKLDLFLTAFGLLYGAGKGFAKALFPESS